MKFKSFRLYGHRKYDNWDGGGMLCQAPEGYEIIIHLGNFSIKLLWSYTKRQLDRLWKVSPEEWDNCKHIYR